MLLKSGSEIYLCISLILLSWGFTSAFFFPDIEKTAARENPVYTYSSRSMSSLFRRFVEIDPIIKYLPINMEDAALIQQLKSHNTELQNTNQFLMKIAERSLENRALLGETEIDELIKLKTEKLQSQITANTAAIENLMSKIANMVPKTDSEVLKEDKDVPEDEIELVLQGEGEGEGDSEDVLESQVNKELYQYKGGDNSKFQRDLFYLMKEIESQVNKELDQDKEDANGEDGLESQEDTSELDRELSSIWKAMTMGLDQSKVEGKVENVLESQEDKEFDQYEGEGENIELLHTMEQLDSQIEQRKNWFDIEDDESPWVIQKDEDALETQKDEGALEIEDDESSWVTQKDEDALEPQKDEESNDDDYNDYENGM